MSHIGGFQRLKMTHKQIINNPDKIPINNNARNKIKNDFLLDSWQPIISLQLVA